MSTLREQLEKISNDNLVTIDKLLDTDFELEIDYNNLDKKIELKQNADSKYGLFTVKESEVVETISAADKFLSNATLCTVNNLTDEFINFKVHMKDCISDLKRETEFLDKRIIHLQRGVLYLILPLVLFCFYYVMRQIL